MPLVLPSICIFKCRLEHLKCYKAPIGLITPSLSTLRCALIFTLPFPAAVCHSVFTSYYLPLLTSYTINHYVLTSYLLYLAPFLYCILLTQVEDQHSLACITMWFICYLLYFPFPITPFPSEQSTFLFILLLVLGKMHIWAANSTFAKILRSSNLSKWVQTPPHGLENPKPYQHCLAFSLPIFLLSVTT